MRERTHENSLGLGWIGVDDGRSSAQRLMASRLRAGHRRHPMHHSELLKKQQYRVFLFWRTRGRRYPVVYLDRRRRPGDPSTDNWYLVCRELADRYPFMYPISSRGGRDSFCVCAFGLTFCGRGPRPQAGVGSPAGRRRAAGASARRHDLLQSFVRLHGAPAARRPGTKSRNKRRLRAGAPEAGGRRPQACAWIQSSTTPSSTSSGTSPVRRTRSWKRLMSNFSPSAACALSRRASIRKRPSM